MHALLFCILEARRDSAWHCWSRGNKGDPLVFREQIPVRVGRIVVEVMGKGKGFAFSRLIWKVVFGAKVRDEPEVALGVAGKGKA